MKHVIKTPLAVLGLMLLGAAQAHEPSKPQTDEMADEMPMVEDHMKEKSNLESMPETQVNKSTHDHRKLKGLPSLTKPVDSDVEDSDKPEGHDHRKEHK